MIDVGAKLLSAAIGGGFAALIFASPAAAEPAPLPDPAPAPIPAPAPVLVAAPAPVPAPASEGVPHLPSPDALPVGTTMDPNLANRDTTPNASYLRDLWQAVQSREISGKEALILGLSQRGMNTPVPAQAPGPNVPIQYPSDPAAPPAPAPEAPAPVPAPEPAPTN